MEDFIAATAFFAAFTVLFVLAILTIRPFIQYSVMETPAAPSQDAPTRLLYAYNVSGHIFLVEYKGDVELFQGFVGIKGPLIAIFYVYPGGYRCERFTDKPVRFGADPYTGFWCPAPYEEVKIGPSCVPVGIASKGRWLLVQYRC